MLKQTPRRTLQECRGEEHVSDEIQCLLLGGHFPQANEEIQEAPANFVSVALKQTIRAGCKDYPMSVAMGFMMSAEKEEKYPEEFWISSILRYIERECKNEPDVLAAFNTAFPKSAKD